MEQIFNKLVRDEIPNIIKNNGDEPVIRILSEEEYRMELYKKLEEEKNEVINSKSKQELIEELVDIYEVLNAILIANDISTNEVEIIRKQKLIKRGGFAKKIFLEKTISKK